MIKAIILVLCATLLLSACGGGEEPSTEIGYGEISEGVYTNAYFNMRVQAPQGWSIQSQAAQQEMMDSGSSLLAGDDENFKAVLKESEKQTVNLFSFFKFEQGAPVDFNPSIISVAERIVQLPGIQRGGDYLHHVKQVLKAGQLAYQFPQDMHEMNISGVTFDVLPAYIDLGTVRVYQDYYAAKLKDYALSFVLSYSNEEEKQELEALVKSMSL